MSRTRSHLRPLTGLLVAVAALVAWALPAAADGATPLTVTPTHGAAGASFDVSSTGCEPSGAIAMAAIVAIDDVFIDFNGATVADGEWSTELVPPADTRPGTYDVIADCSDYDGYALDPATVYADASYTVDFPASVPTGTGSLTLDKATVKAGDTVTATGTGNPDDLMNIALYSSPVLLTPEPVKTGADGRFSATVTIPSDTPLGDHTLVAVNMQSRLDGVVLATPVTVSGATTTATPSSGNLAHTGSDGTGPLTLAGMALLLVGAASVLGARGGRGIRRTGS